MSNPQVGQWVQYWPSEAESLEWGDARVADYGSDEVGAALILEVHPSGSCNIEVHHPRSYQTTTINRNQGDGPGTWRPIPVEIPTAHLAKHPDENLALGVADAYTAGMKVRDLEAQVRELEEALATEREITRGQRATLDVQLKHIREKEYSVKFAHTQINELVARVKDLEAMIQSMDEASRDRINRVTSLEDTINDLETTNVELEEANQDLGNTVRELKGEIREWEHRGQGLQEAIESLNRTIERLQERLEDEAPSESVLRAAEARILELETQLMEGVTIMARHQGRILELGHEASAKVSAAGEERDSAVAWANQVTTERNELGAKVTELESTLMGRAIQVSELEARIVRANKMAEDYSGKLIQERNRAEASVQELTGELDKARTEYNELAAEANSWAQDRNGARDRADLLEVKLDDSRANEVKLIGERDKAWIANNELRWQLEELGGIVDECHENEVRLVAERDMLKEATDTLAKGRSEATERALFLARDLDQARKGIDGLEETLAANREAPGLVRDLEMAGARIGEQAARIVGLEAELENSRDQFMAAARIVGQDTTAQIRIKELEDMLASNLNHLHGLERQLRATAKMLVESQQEAAARDREVSDLQAEVEHRAGTYLASMDTLEARIHDLRMKMEDSATSEVRLIGERDYYQAQINRLAEHLGLTGGPEDEGGPVTVAIHQLEVMKVERERYRDTESRDALWSFTELERLAEFLGLELDEWADGEGVSVARQAIDRINILDSSLEGAHALIEATEPEPDPQTEAARTMLADFLAEQEAERNAYYSPLEEQAQDLLEAVQIAVAGSGHQVLRDMARVLGALERMEEEPVPVPIDTYEVYSEGTLIWRRMVQAGDIIQPPVREGGDGALHIPGMPGVWGDPWEFVFTPAHGEKTVVSGPGLHDKPPATPLTQVPLNESPFITEHGSGA